MDWLKRLLPKPSEKSGGFLVPTQRTALNLSGIDLRSGVVTLKTGEVRCFLRLTGFTVHHRSEGEAMAWLQGYARALNTLPGNAVLIVRSRPGGLDRSVRQIAQQTHALATREPAALARLAEDQQAHMERMHLETRLTTQYAALHSPKGNVRALLDAAQRVKTHLQTAGMGAELVTDRALAQALADDWRPTGPAGFHQEIIFPQDSRSVMAVLKYAPRDTHVSATPGRTVDEAA